MKLYLGLTLLVVACLLQPGDGFSKKKGKWKLYALAGGAAAGAAGGVFAGGLLGKTHKDDHHYHHTPEHYGWEENLRAYHERHVREYKSLDHGWEPHGWDHWEGGQHHGW